MATAVDIVVNVVTKMDASGMSQAEGKIGKFQSGLKKATVPALAAAGAITAFGVASVKAASDLQQSQGAVESVFGSSADKILEWSKTSSTAVGLAQSDYQQMSATIGAQLKNMGVPMDQVAGKTNNLIKTAADLSATFGGTTGEAVEALSATLRGETDPIEKYGISLKQADIAAQMAKDGTDKLTGSAAKQAKTAATLALVTQQSADAHGAFARESDTAAHQAQVASAQYEDMKAVLGTALLPAVTALMAVLASLAGWVQENTTVAYVLIGVIGALAAVVLLANVALKVYAAGQAIVTAAQWAWNAAMSANPIGLLIIAVLLLVAGIILLWKRSETFRKIVTAVWSAVRAAAMVAWNAIKGVVMGVFDWIKSHWPLLVAIITGPVGIAALLIIKNWDKIKAVALAVWVAIKSGAKKLQVALKTIWSAIKAAVKAVADAIKAIWRAVWKAATTYVKAYVATAKTVFNALRAAIGFVIDKVRALIAKIRDIKIPDSIKSHIIAVREAISTVITKAGDLIRKIADIVVPDKIKSAFDNIADAAENIVDFIDDIISGLKSIPVPHIDWPSPPSWLNKVLGRSVIAPPTPALTPSGMVGTPRIRRPVPREAGSVAPVVINVSGALDPDAVARQIGRLLGAHNRRVGVSR